MNGQGKGWSKGRTAATDPRIARNAAAHRGQRYRRHMPPELDRRRLNGQGIYAGRTIPLEWSPTMAYVVGLMATDGCLVNTGRHLTFGSKDRDLVELFLRSLGRPIGCETVLTVRGAEYYRKQFGDVAFYQWLEGVGLSQRKSLLIGAIDVPDEYFMDLARGLLDGDGSIVNKWYAGTGKARGKKYETLLTRFVSGSAQHITWLRSALERLIRIRGCVIRPTAQNSCWTLSYAIRESCILLPLIYRNEELPKLERKWRIWKGYAERHGHPATRIERELAGEYSDPSVWASRDSLGRFRRLSMKEDAGVYASRGVPAGLLCAGRPGGTLPISFESSLPEWRNWRDASA